MNWLSSSVAGGAAIKGVASGAPQNAPPQAARQGREAAFKKSRRSKALRMVLEVSVIKITQIQAPEGATSCSLLRKPRDHVTQKLRLSHGSGDVRIPRLEVLTPPLPGL